LETLQGKDLLLSPFILPTNLIFLLRCEVILDIESLADLLGRFAFDHVGNGLATDIEKCFNIQVVGGLNGDTRISLFHQPELVHTRTPQLA
jgi:hypothetical protein